MTESGYFPIEILNKIKEYIPKDRQMSSPTVKCIINLMDLYNNYNPEWYYEIDPSEYNNFSEYCLRINRLERIYGIRLNCEN